MARHVPQAARAIAAVASSTARVMAACGSWVAWRQQHPVGWDDEAVEGALCHRMGGIDDVDASLVPQWRGTTKTPSPSGPLVPSSRATSAISSAVVPSRTNAFCPVEHPAAAVGRAVAATETDPNDRPRSAKARVPVAPDSATGRRNRSCCSRRPRLADHRRELGQGGEEGAGCH